MLQEPAIVPQTIFFSNRPIEDTSESSSNRLIPANSSRATSDTWTRRFSFDAPRSITAPIGSRQVSGAHQPLDDLRRRLALAAGASTLSLNSIDTTMTNDLNRFPAAPSSVLGSDRASSIASTDDLSDTPTTLHDTAVINPATKSIRSKVDGHGVQVGRASAAIGQDSTNVMGLFNVEARYSSMKTEEDAASGISSPVDTNVIGRGARPMRGAGGQPTLRFTSTYGSFLFCIELFTRLMLCYIKRGTI